MHLAGASHPPLELRLALAAAQMIVYHQRFEYSDSDLRTFVALFEEQKHHFHASYVQKVLAELVGASKEALARGGEEAEEDEEDVLDAALEKMLDAKMDGMGDFDDDFDDEGLAVEGPGDDDGEGASDGADEEEDDVLERMLGGARASKKPRVA